MSAVLAFLDQLTLGQPQVVHNLSLYPPVAEGPAEAGYRRPGSEGALVAKPRPG